MIRFLGQHWGTYKMLLGGDLQGRLPQRVTRYTINVLNDVDIVQLAKECAENLNGLLRMSVDAWFLTKSTTTALLEDNTVGVKTRYELIYPNSWGSVNDTEILRNDEDVEQMLSEIQPDAFKSKLLDNTFLRRNVYKESNVQLHRILSYQIIINVYPPSWLHK